MDEKEMEKKSVKELLEMQEKLDNFIYEKTHSKPTGKPNIIHQIEQECIQR